MSTIYKFRRIPSTMVMRFSDEPGKTARLDAKASQAVCQHTDDFDWGYTGRMSVQLSAALLLDVLTNTPPEQRPTQEDPVEIAKRWHLSFNNDVVTQWVDDVFQIEAKFILGWLRQVIEQAATKKRVYNADVQWPTNTPMGGGGTTFVGG